MKRLRVFVPVALLVAVCLVLTGWRYGWHHSDDVPSGEGGVTREGSINGGRLAILYEDRLISPRDLYLLQRQGLAMAGVVTGPLACQGVTMQFDTQPEVDAYMAEHPELAKGQVPCTGVPLHPAFQRGSR